MGGIHDLQPAPSDPNYRVLMRLGLLEARIAAMESHRDIVFTPVTFTVSTSTSVEWSGGRAWLIVAARISSTGLGNTNLVINGVTWRNRTVVAAGSDQFSGIVADDATDALTLGTNTLSTTVSGAATDALWNGLFIEWPQA